MEQKNTYRARLTLTFLVIVAMTMLGLTAQVSSQANTPNNTATSNTLPASAYRLAVVNFTQLLSQAPQSLAETRRLESVFSVRESELAQEKLQLENTQQQLALTRDTISAEELIQRERDLRSRQRTYFRKLEDYREEVSIARNDSLQQLQDVIDRAVEAVRARDNIDLVLRESQYMVASERINITPVVLVYLEQQFQQPKRTQSSSSIVSEPDEN